MSEQQSEYRSIFKATSIFGGVQVFNILISLIRGKALAILIGTAGMGLNGLLMSGLNLISTISGLGISQSAVRDISTAHGSGDEIKVRRVYTVFRRWIWFTAGLGMLLTIGLSSVLSKLSFGDGSHTWSYVLLSGTFVFGALAGGIYTLLRGIRRIKDLALANVLGALAGLAAALPIFYIWGIQGVVPAILVTSLVTYLVSLYFSKKVNIKTIALGWHETFAEGKEMVQLGISLSITVLMASAATYALNAYITRVGTLSDLGLYSSGMTIVSSYVGMVFTAMGTDYFPRLSAIIHNEKRWQELVNQQSELVILILGPLLTLLMASAPILIRILLSAEFMATIPFLIWAVLAILLKGLVWAQGFVIIAKGQNKLYLLTEALGTLWFLALNIVFFKIYGVMGLGISMLISYILSTIMMWVVMKWKFKYQISQTLGFISVFFFVLLALSLGCIYWFDFPGAYLSGAFIFIITAVFSLYELNKRMNLRELVSSLKVKFLTKK